MYNVVKISADEAIQLIRVAADEANLLGKQIAIAIAGPEGELIGFLRMDGANAASSEIARSKAYTSARDRKTTRELGEFMRTQDREAAYWTDTKITGFGGGVPIRINNNIIGAIGISGLSEAEDERVAELAIKKIFF